jgi:pimeloyl-ACP methyl ester carboxylesterase
VPAQLHHERIATGEPSRWLVFAHGIFGSSANWRTIARRVVERRPEWGIALVDLRGHGRSEHGDPPDTVAACAEDVRAFAAQHGGVDAVGGHSYGGKVALAARPTMQVAQTWVFDASPSTRERADTDDANTVLHVLRVLERLPRTFGRRDDFIADVVASGIPPDLARWLAMNIIPDGRGAFVSRLDVVQMRALLGDYFAHDLWASLEDPAYGAVELVIALRSSTLDAADRARLARAPAHVHVDRIDADHWLNVSAPDAVVELLATRLPR